MEMLRADRAMVKRWRIPVIYSVAVPLALILGYLVSSPDEITFTVLAMVMFFLALPLILKWHHALLIIFWNAAFNAYFLPGQPDAWLLFGALSFGISFMNHIILLLPPYINSHVHSFFFASHFSGATHHPPSAAPVL